MRAGWRCRKGEHWDAETTARCAAGHRCRDGRAGRFPAPALAQGIKELKLVTSYPRDLPGFGASAERLGRSITAMSNGRLKIAVYPAGSLVKALEVL